MSNIRILIADDHAIVREGLRVLISNEAGLELVGEARDGNEAVEQARRLKPDVILMDLVMPGKSGQVAIEEIMRENTDARILVLTSFGEDEKLFPAIKSGAHGYLLKDSLPGELLQAIRDVYAGSSSLHPAIALKVIREIRQPSNLKPPTESPLTDREMGVLKLVAQGLTNQEIADELKISEWTVRTHVRNVMRKLHLANRTQATLYALREGLTKL